MSIKVMSVVWEWPGLDPYERLLMLALADHADDLGSCYPSVARLCERTGMAERGVQKVVKRLCERGLLSVKTGGGRGGANVYRIPLNPAPGAPIADDKPRTPDTPAPRTPPHLSAETPHLSAINPAPGAPEPSGTVKEPSSARKPKQQPNRFEEFWNAYPHRGGAKKGKAEAVKSYAKAVQAGVSEQILIEAAERYHGDRQVGAGFAKDPATWLNQSGWQDEIEPPVPRQSGADDRAKKLARWKNIGERAS